MVKIATTLGTESAWGERTAIPGLVIAEYAGRWTVTHQRSGRRAAATSTLEDARRLVSELALTGVNWTASYEDIPDDPNWKQAVHAIKRFSGAQS